jgi:hypothetical protein
MDIPIASNPAVNWFSGLTDRSEPRSSTIYLKLFSEFFMKKTVLFVRVSDLEWQQDRKQQQHVPLMDCESYSTDRQVDKKVHGMLNARVQAVRYQILRLWSHGKRVSQLRAGKLRQ